MEKTKLPFPPERLDLILLALSGQASVTELCKQAGVSRELFYRWMRRVKEASLAALEAQGPGPKKFKDQDKLVKKYQKLSERMKRKDKETAKLRRERDHLKEVVGITSRIIQRRKWGPLPEERVKKNSTTALRLEKLALKNGPASPKTQPFADLFRAGGSTEAPTGDGFTENPLGQGESQGK